MIGKAKFIIPLIFLSLASWPMLKGQEECVFILERAERLYQQGQIQEIPGLLMACIEKGFTREERLDAYKLAIQSYLFVDELEEAESMVLEFLGKYPEYEVTPADPAEFVYLVNSYKTFPAFSLGVTLGGVLSFPYSTEQFGTHSLSDASADYTASGPGFQFGASIIRYLGPQLDLNLEVNYQQKEYKYNLSPYEFEEIRFKETISSISLPLTVTYDFGTGKFRPFARLGMMTDLNLISSIDPKRDYTNGAFDQVSGDDIVTSDIGSRDLFSFYPVVGAGLKYRVARIGYFMLDLRFQPGLNTLTKAENRYDYHNDQIWRYHNIDDKLRINQFTFSLGWIYPIYVSRKQPIIQ
jgi:hypothetical protein